MRCKGVRLLATALCGGALLLSQGCVVGADLLNPDFVVGLGIDPLTVYPPLGTIVVLFTNNTDSPAVFYAFESVDAGDLTRDSRNFSVRVPANSNRNEVLECPVGLLSPGELGADFTRQNTAADVLATGGGATVDYVGTVLLDGQEFKCGDVVEIRLDPAGTAYVISVRVIPGG